MNYLTNTLITLAAVGIFGAPASAEQRDLSPAPQLQRVEAQIKQDKAHLSELQELRSYFKDSLECVKLTDKYESTCDTLEQKTKSKKTKAQCQRLHKSIDALWESWLDTPDFNSRLEQYGFCGVDYVGD